MVALISEMMGSPLFSFVAVVVKIDFKHKKRFSVFFKQGNEIGEITLATTD